MPVIPCFDPELLTLDPPAAMNIAYGQQAPTTTLRNEMATECEAIANRLADCYAGQGKVARVTVAVTFGDGSSVSFEAKRNT